MGSICSKPNAHSEGTQVLGGSSGYTASARPSPANDSDARAARARAAEQRLKATQSRGVSAANPNSGKLAAKVAQPLKDTPEAPPERVVWD